MTRAAFLKRVSQRLGGVEVTPAMLEVAIRQGGFTPPPKAGDGWRTFSDADVANLAEHLRKNSRKVRSQLAVA